MNKRTTLIYKGATPEGIKLIKKLLNENDFKNNSIRNRVVCLDTPDKIYKLQEFLSQEEFVFYAIDPKFPTNINEDINTVVIMNE